MAGTRPGAHARLLLPIGPEAGPVWQELARVSAHASELLPRGRDRSYSLNHLPGDMSDHPLTSADVAPEKCSREASAAKRAYAEHPAAEITPVGTRAGPTRTSLSSFFAYDASSSPIPLGFRYNEWRKISSRPRGASRPRENKPPILCPFVQGAGGWSWGSRSADRHVDGNVPLPCHGSPGTRHGRLPNAAEPLGPRLPAVGEYPHALQGIVEEEQREVAADLGDALVDAKLGVEEEHPKAGEKQHQRRSRDEPG